MTTNVKIEAHCSEKEEVFVTVLDDGGVAETFYLQDGESRETYVYDERIVVVREIEKSKKHL